MQNCLPGSRRLSTNEGTSSLLTRPNQLGTKMTRQRSLNDLISERRELNSHESRHHVGHKPVVLNSSKIAVLQSNPKE